MANEPAPGKVRVRTTFWPDEDIEMDADEMAVLRHQGLLCEQDEATAPAKGTKPASGAASASKDGI